MSARHRHFPWVTLVVSIVLVLYYALVYRPLSRRAEALDRPLTSLWEALAAQGVDPGDAHGPAVAQIGDSLHRVEASMLRLDELSRTLKTRLDWEPRVRAQLNQPFQLIDFQNDRQNRIEALDRLAKQRQVNLEPSVLASFPEYTVDKASPALLWLQLALLDHVLTSAVNAQVGVIKTATLPAVKTHRLAAQGQEFLDEIPVRLELSGSMAAVTRFLLSLPRSAAELSTLDLPATPPSKPALFIERLMLRKQTPEQPDAVVLDVLVIGFSYRA